MSVPPRPARTPRPIVSGWKGQSILIFRHLTGPRSTARAEGLMPGYAHQAYRIALAAGALAGMAKKRWRDGSAERMTIQDVRRLRNRIVDAFDDLERTVDSTGPGRTGVKDQDAAEDVYEAHGLVGHLGLCMMEEAAELAEPIHAVATGRAAMSDMRTSISAESADVRTYLHLSDTLFGVDPVSTTQAKWEEFLARMPEHVRAALLPVRMTEDEIRESFAVMAKTRI